MTCTMCSGSQLLMAGWMGPTPQRPYPDPCPECSSDLSPRARQVLQHEWLHDHLEEPHVQELLARMAVFNRDKYELVIVCPHVRDPLVAVSTKDLAKADLVIVYGNQVVKDRYGITPYTLSDGEVRRIRDEAKLVRVVTVK